MSLHIHIQLVRLLFVAVLVATLGGCGTLPASPNSSMAPFVQVDSEEEATGKLSASTGVSYLEEILFAPTGRGSLTWRAAERYDLAAHASTWGAGLQGNFVVVDNPSLRVGVVHGVTGNGGELVDLSGLFATAGLFVQQSAQRPSAWYGGLRYTHYVVGSSPLDPFADLAVGWTTSRGVLRLGPELLLTVYPFPAPFVSLHFHLEARF